jgi:hypothetical protein
MLRNSGKKMFSQTQSRNFMDKSWCAGTTLTAMKLCAARKASALWIHTLINFVQCNPLWRVPIKTDTGLRVSFNSPFTVISSPVSTAGLFIPLRLALYTAIRQTYWNRGSYKFYITDPSRSVARQQLTIYRLPVINSNHRSYLTCIVCPVIPENCRNNCKLEKINRIGSSTNDLWHSRPQKFKLFLWSHFICNLYQ